MTPDELMRLCDEPCPLRGAPHVPDHIYLTMHVKQPASRTIMLCGNRGPRGLVCNVKAAAEGYRAVAAFKRKAVKAFVRKAIKSGDL